MATVRFRSVTVRAWNGSSGSAFRFRRFCKKGFSVFQYSLTGKDGSGSGFGSGKMVPAVPVPLSVSGKTVPTVPVSGSGSVPEPKDQKKMKVSSEIEIFERATHRGPIFRGEIETSRLKFSSEIINFDRD